MKNKICIIALGKLGHVLYQKLESHDFQVSGTYFHTPKAQMNCFFYDINQTDIPQEILEAQTVILNLPPSVMSSIDRLKDFLQKIQDKHIIFISSTSVYGPQGFVDENTVPEPDTAGGGFLLEQEKLIQKTISHYKIIRAGGLYGPDRHPARFLAGKKNIKGANLPVNLVSHEDLAQLILQTLADHRSIFINAVNAHHPLKKDFYTTACRSLKLTPPLFTDHLETQIKQVSTIYPEYKITTTLYKDLL